MIKIVSDAIGVIICNMCSIIIISLTYQIGSIVGFGMCVVYTVVVVVS